uniref:Uncharacterized protein n=1 Tax=Chelydra serpentina TaxID=8475 RepID=A0A8C3SDV8_CHESE
MRNFIFCLIFTLFCNGKKSKIADFSVNRKNHFPPCSIYYIVGTLMQATWMAYDMVVMRTNPDLANSMRRLEDAFLNCKEEMEKNWQEMLKETKGTEQKQE